MSSREERVTKNEAVTREINERIEEAKAGGPSESHLRMLCECGQPQCSDLVAITIGEYQQVRSDPRTFAVANGHVVVDVEFVVSETGRFTVVQKREGTPAGVAEALDPRS